MTQLRPALLLSLTLVASCASAQPPVGSSDGAAAEADEGSGTRGGYQRYELAHCGASAIFPAEPPLMDKELDENGRAVFAAYFLKYEDVGYGVTCSREVASNQPAANLVEAAHGGALAGVMQDSGGDIVRESTKGDMRRTAVHTSVGIVEVQTQILGSSPITMLLIHADALPPDRVEAFLGSLQASGGS